MSISTTIYRFKKYLCTYRIKKIRDNRYVTPSVMVDNYIINNNTLTNVNKELVGEFYVPYNANVNSPTIIGEKAFDSCDKITRIEMNNNITDIGIAAFRKCSNVQFIVMSNNVNILRANTFETCTSLLAMNLSNIEQIGDYCFLYNTSLSVIQLSSNLTYIGVSAFQHCHN